ncbi:hypothetical protein [Muriicola sp.]|uniref:hypothetical protein n=1 Tax=Muriicola sp. TaxID=2020856 RepID=UPI003561FC95
MGSLERRLQAFVKLGHFLRDFRLDDSSSGTSDDEFTRAVERAGSRNGWFTRENLRHALSAWGKELTEENMRTWISDYETPQKDPKVVAIIMAGNIPLVGFHDLLCVLITGHRALVKLASGDTELLPAVIKKLEGFEPELKGSTEFSKGVMKGFDAVIAT